MKSYIFIFTLQFSILLSLVFAGFISFQLTAEANHCPANTPCQGNHSGGGFQNPMNNIGSLSYSIISPLQNISSITDLLLALLTVFITVATPIVVLFIIIAGFKYVTARGNANQVGEATRAITYALIGGLLILGAVAIAGIITNVVNSLSS